MPIFPSDDAIIRLIGAIRPEAKSEWTVARRDVSLETLAHLKDNPDVRLLTVTSCSDLGFPEGWRFYTTF
jgi:hypothetical protein